MPVMKPDMSERNFTPNSTAFVSPESTTAGVGLLLQILVAGALVVNDEVNVVASALPATSLTLGSTVPPNTLTV
jgi:hypothetical protein